MSQVIHLLTSENARFSEPSPYRPDQPKPLKFWTPEIV